MTSRSKPLTLPLDTDDEHLARRIAREIHKKDRRERARRRDLERREAHKARDARWK